MLFEKLDRYLVDQSYKMIIKNNYINIINYREIKDFSNTKVIVSLDKGDIVIEGKDLVVSRMQDDEVVIMGKVMKILL